MHRMQRAPAYRAPPAVSSHRSAWNDRSRRIWRLVLVIALYLPVAGGISFAATAIGASWLVFVALAAYFALCVRAVNRHTVTAHSATGTVLAF